MTYLNAAVLLCSTDFKMNFDRYIPSRRNFDIDVANFRINNQTMEEKNNDYLRSTPVVQQEMNILKKLRYSRELANGFNYHDSVQILSSNNEHYKSYANLEDWPVHPRMKPVRRPRLAALDLPNIRNDIYCNVLNWSSSNHIVAALGKIIYLWHVPSSTMTKILRNNREIMALKMNVDSTKLAFTGEEPEKCMLRIWDLKSSSVMEVRNPLGCFGHKCHISCIEYHPSNKYIILGCERGNIVVKTVDMKHVSSKTKAHNSFKVIKIKCSPDGRYVATSGLDGDVHVWSFPHLKLVVSHSEKFCSRGLSWHPWRCSYLCIGTTNGSMSLINVASGETIAHVEDRVSILYDVSFNKISGELVTSQAFYVPNSEPQMFKSQINVLSNFHCIVDRFEGHSRRVLFLEWSPDNRILASASSDETIHLWKFFDGNSKNTVKKGMIKSTFNLDNYIR